MFDKENHSISSLTDQHQTRDFDCGDHSFNYFLNKHALKNQNDNLGQVFVLHRTDSKRILGYYTLHTAKAQKLDFPSSISVRLPEYPIPCILIGRLAVDLSIAKAGVGAFLLFDALSRAKSISQSVGCYAVTVDAIETAVDFYRKYGFQSFTNSTRSLFLEIAAIP